MKRWRVVIGVGLAILALLVVGLVLGSSIGNPNDFWHYPGAMMGGGHGSLFGMPPFGSGILMLLFWGIVIVGLALLISGLSGRENKPTETSEGSLEILKRRYARGEIDREEFERIKESLSQ